VRRGGRDIKKMPRSLLRGAAGVVGHESRVGVSDHPACGAKVGFAENFLNAAATPPHEEGISLAQTSALYPDFCKHTLCVNVGSVTTF
jgi:hypothetical protein